MYFIIKNRLFLIFSLLIFIGLPAAAKGSDIVKKPLRIGIYDNPPKLFLDKNKTPKGIFPGIIEEIASKEGWKIQFIPVSFRQGLNGLENGNIDVMQDVAWSKQRSQKYGYTTETVMVSWGRVYQRNGLNINTLIDLTGKRIAFMDGGIYSEGTDGLIQLMKKFELNAHYVPVKGYQQVLEAISNGHADAGVVNRLYGKRNKDRYDIDNTPILISPISIRFAFNKNSTLTPYLIDTIDKHLRAMKKDNNSVYYELIDEYIREPKAMVPGLLKNLLWFLFLCCTFLAFIGIVSSWQVKKKTAQLRKRDKELMESENKFRTIFENLQDVYFKTTLDGQILMISPSIEKYTGYQTDKLIGRNVLAAYQNESDRKTFISKIMDNGMVRDYQILLKKKNLESFWVSINADLDFDESGQPVGIQGIMRDITRQKKAEDQLKEREERFREMARLLPCGIIETDLDLGITYINQAGLEMFGYTQQDIDRGLNILNIIHPDEKKRLQNRTEKHLLEQSVSPAEYHMFKKGETELTILYDSTPILQNEKIVGFRGSLVDLTEIRQLQKELLRTQKLESTGLLAGGIAHDFNNILLGLFGNLSLAKNELQASSEAYKLIEEANKSMARAKDLTSQLLTFAQGGDPIKKNIPLDQVVRETALFHLSGSNIKFVMEKPETLSRINADENQISQVISNLVINARHAMPNGGRLLIKLENAAVSSNEFSSFELDNYVKLTVRDQGTGIPEKYLDKIFDPYFTTKHDGSGLGLAIVHSIILKHYGYIYVNSTLGKGTSFVIYLPGADVQEEVAEIKKTGPVLSKPIPPSYILVMDDDPLVREVSERMLNKLGHTVDLCNDGKTAVDMYQKAWHSDKPYDLIFMDLTIPGGMGGKEAVKKVLDINPAAKVVVASGYSNDPVMANFKNYGFKAMATKPYAVEKMSVILQKAFSD